MSHRETEYARGVTVCPLSADSILCVAMKPRWTVRVQTKDGQVIHESRFWSGRRAKALKRWHETTAIGGHKWQTSVPAGDAPLWTVEVERDRRR